MTKRISYIDNTRAISIALVVLGHILNYANPKYDIVPYVLVQQFLDSFHMPAFFILSGMLTDGDKWRGRSVGSFLLIAAVEAVLIFAINRFCPMLVGKKRKEKSNG